MADYHPRNRRKTRAEQIGDKNSNDVYPLAGTFLIGVVVGGLALAAITN